MLYYKKLDSLFFNSFPNQTTDFWVLTGFIGPDPISKLGTLPFNSKVIYGLFKENQKKELHDKLVTLNTDKTKIYYPDLACHSKCYLWMKNDKPIKGFIGSANFSSNGLMNDYRESLMEIDDNQLFMLKGYIDIIFSTSKECTLFDVKADQTRVQLDICDVILYDPITGQTQNGAGINWGFAEGSHVRQNDAYLPIRTNYIKQSPQLFPPIQYNPERRRGALVEVIEMVWDDGISMLGKLEGSQPIGELKYPKQISTFPHKDQLGKYLRDRLGVEHGKRVTMEDLMRYGKTSISVSLIQEGVYYFDFKKP
jgi:hypothetical protein